jgi:ABC-type Fe3+ transport system permease subunit
MSRLSGVATILAWAVRTALVLLLLGLFAAGFLERTGPGAGLRPTWFYGALGVFDPLLRDATLHSFLLALGVTLAATGLGDLIATVCSRSRLARPLVAALGALALVTPPPVAALGLRNLADRIGVTPSESGPWFTGILLGLGELPWATALVAGLLTRRLDRLDPRWSDQARLAGGSRGAVRAAAFLVRPILRPEAARAASLVFLTTACEPGAPLVLGEGRYLASQVVLHATDGSSRALVAVIALLTLGLGLVGFALIRGWVGVAHDEHPGADGPDRPRYGAMASGQPRSAAIAVVSLGTALSFLAVVTAPLTGLLVPFAAGWDGTEGRPTPSAWADLMGPLAERARDGLILGGSSASLALTLAMLWLVGSRAGPRLWSSRGVPIVPAGILAAAVMVVSGLVSWEGNGSPLLGLDPTLLLVFVLAVSVFPSLVPAIRRERRRVEPALADVARMAGVSGLGQFWLASGRGLVRAVVTATLALVWATGVESQAALLLTPGTCFLPPGPALITQGPDPAGVAAASLIGLAIVSSGVALRLCGCRATWLGLADRG